MTDTRSPIKLHSAPRIGLYTIGLAAYWAQFPELRGRIMDYGAFIADRMSGMAEVYNFGLVDSETSARAAGLWFNERHVDLVFCHSATYSTSSAVLPVHQICPKPAVILNLQPAARIDYAHAATGEWLAHCGACPVPEIANAFQRAGVAFRVVNGLLGTEATADRPEAERAWKEIEEWISAARVAAGLRRSRFGFLGNTYSGMLDMYSDFTMVQAQTGLHVQVLEMCDLDQRLKAVTPDAVQDKAAEMNRLFSISGDSAADPIAREPTAEQLKWACTVAAAQERLVRDFDLDALVYFYHGSPGNDYENLQSGFILGHSLLTARGVPCAGEGDLKTAIAMKICDLAGTGGSFSEIVVVDYLDGTILLGHDGPFHAAIADGKPLLRGMGLYHGKMGSGISVEAKVKAGPVTTLNVTQTGEGRLKFIISEGRATGGEIMQIGNTQTPVRFCRDPDAYMSAWFAQAPTHHCALSVGHNASLFRKVAELLDIPHATLCEGSE